MEEFSWDVFISYAREDKESVVRPLAEALRRVGLRVWIDWHEILLGDSLTGKINQGLAESRYGIVILSPAFLSKEWPKRELAALLAIGIQEGRRVLPVLHNLGRETLLRELPLMADKVWVSTEAGIEEIACEVRRALGFKRETNSVAERLLPPALGSRIGPYEVEAHLGAGGSGEVYRVRSDNHPYPLALKLFYPLRPVYAHLYPLFGRGFRAVAAVRHPNIICVYDHGVWNLGESKRAYFTMDLIDGLALDIWCRRVKDPAERYRTALPVFRDVAAALCAAHETSYFDELGFEVRSVLHGDVKPANIIVDKTGNARVVDFLQLDVQRLIDPNVLSPDVMKPTAGMTQIMGTPGFMAPEQARFGILSVATDIYGLGITFANALADGNTSNPLFNPDMPDAFRELVWRMVDSEPGKRPAQMKEVLSALEELNQEAG